MDKELLFTYNLLIDKIAALRAEAKETASAILQNGTSSYFQKYGNIVEQIYWNQYTPWFNDGETCEFSVNEPTVVLVDDEDENKYTEGIAFDTNLSYYEEQLALWAEFNADPDAYMDKLDIRYFTSYGYDRKTYTPHWQTVEELENRIAQIKSYPEGFVEDTKSLLTFISSIDPAIMEELFENHVTVRITANGIETEEYSHE